MGKRSPPSPRYAAEDAPSFAAYMRGERTARRWSLEIAAERLFMHPARLSSIETGSQAHISADTLMAVHILFGAAFVPLLRLALLPHRDRMAWVRAAAHQDKVWDETHRG